MSCALSDARFTHLSFHLAAPFFDIKNGAISNELKL